MGGGTEYAGICGEVSVGGWFAFDPSHFSHCLECIPDMVAPGAKYTLRNRFFVRATVNSVGHSVGLVR